MKNDLSKAKELLESGVYSLVAVKNGETVFFSSQDGVVPVVTALEEHRAEFSGASVADKVIGRAVALLMLYGRVAGVYTPMISRGALSVFKADGHEKSGLNDVFYEKTVEFIKNRSGDGMCPMEKLTADINDPEIAFDAVRDFMGGGKNRS